MVTVKIALSIAALITKVERRLAEYPNNRIISVTPNNKTHEAIPTPRANALTVTGKGERQLSSFGSARGGSGDAPGTLNSRVDWGNILETRVYHCCTDRSGTNSHTHATAHIGSTISATDMVANSKVALAEEQHVSLRFTPCGHFKLTLHKYFQHCRVLGQNLCHELSQAGFARKG